jgi:hypothetical protein
MCFNMGASRTNPSAMVIASETGSAQSKPLNKKRLLSKNKSGIT